MNDDFKEYSNPLLLETLEKNIRLINFYESQNKELREILKNRMDKND